jgi:hypothetical protein
MVDKDEKVARFRRDSEAGRQGYHAGRRDRTPADNPYDLDSREGRAWLWGLSEGRKRRLTVVRHSAE